jgi:hypothetical protein
MTTDDRIKTPCPLCRHGATYLAPSFCSTNHGRAIPCPACSHELATLAAEYRAGFDANLAGVGR